MQNPCGEYEYLEEFQFQHGAVKVSCSHVFGGVARLFQFQHGAVKVIRLMPQRYKAKNFNSNMVRLK